MLHGWNKLFVRGVPLKFQHAPLIWQSAFQRTWKEIAWKKRLVVPFVTTMQRLYAFHVWFWLQTIFSCKVKSPSLALSVALSWNWGDLTGVPGVSTDSIIKAITSKHSKHKWDFTTATWAKEQGHQVGYNSIPFWKVHHFALWNHHSTVSAPTMCYPSVYSTSALSSNPLLVATWTCVSHSQWDGIMGSVNSFPGRIRASKHLAR